MLTCPTYSDGERRGAVLRGVIAGGTRNFGETFALSGRVIAQKCNVPLLYSFELAGKTTDDAIGAILDKKETGENPVLTPQPKVGRDISMKGSKMKLTIKHKKTLNTRETRIVADLSPLLPIFWALEKLWGG